jgi:putative endopeptidase
MRRVRLFNRGLAFTVEIIAVAIVLALPAVRARSQSAAERSLDAASHGVELSSMDKTCNACQDFYHYANGDWLKKNPIPSAYPSWGRFDELQKRNREELRQILEKAAADRSAAAGSNEQKIGDYYASCMNVPQIDAAGAKSLQPEFDRIQAIANAHEFQVELAHLQMLGVDAIFNFASTQDEKNSSQVIGGADQGGLGLPDRDYYLKTDDKSKQLRQQYVAHVSKMFELLGDRPAESAAEAETVMNIETNLAKASMDRVERRDPDKTYHKMSIVQLQALTPNFRWQNYFHEIGAPPIDSVDVVVPEFFQALNSDLNSVSLADWKVYLRWHLINSTGRWLSQPFVDENFNFKGKILQGTKENLPRWQRCVAATDNQLGEALGQIYVKEYFPPEAKVRAQKMINDLIAALRDDLQTLPWMGPSTRKEALAKLNAFTVKIGYPDKWRDYSAYHVDRGPFVLDTLRADEFESRRDLDKIGKPVDRTEWGMTPPTVDAYNNGVMNEIVFPAGILQPPFFDAKADDASNYGAIGAVIGHEMTHGFDDEGRKFDAHGNLRDWWTPADEKNFNDRAQCIVNQFNNYVAIDDVHENGKLVLGESIADLGGLTIAYNALEKDLQGEPRPLIGGYTPEQRFFLAYSQIWAATDRPEFVRLMANLNPHALDRIRSVAAPSNMPAFAKAFDCKADDVMVRPASLRCQIW